MASFDVKTKYSKYKDCKLRTGRTRRSGYCEYPAMKFDRSKMAEFEEES